MFNRDKTRLCGGSGNQAPPVLFQVIPPRSGEFGTREFVNTLEALHVVDETLSFELVATENQVTMYVRSFRPDHVLATLGARYPQARFETVPAEEDPLLMKEGTGTVFRQVLWPGGEEWLPLQVLESDDEGDPIAEIVGGLSAESSPGCRVVTRVVLSERDRASTERWRHRALTGSGSANQQLAEAKTRGEQKVQAESQSGDVPSGSTQNLQLLVFGGPLILAFLGAIIHQTLMSLWMEHRIEVVAGGVLAAGALVGLGYLLIRLGLFKGKPEPKFYDPDQVKLRVMGAAFRLEVQLFAMYEEGVAEREVAVRALQPVVASYRRFDNPMGDRFESGPIETIDGLDPARADLGFVGVCRDILGRVRIGEGVVGTREAAALWHVPGDAVNAPSLLRAGSRRLPVPSEMFVLEDGQRGEAAIVGLEKYGDGGLRKMHFPAATWRSSFLIVASSGMGKSTLTGHLTRSLLRDIAAGGSDAALVVVDPHADLVNDIMEGMPVGAAGDVRLIDLGDPTRACGINLLDVTTFPERGLAVSMILVVARSSSLNWGDRMEEILRWSLYALYEANVHRDPEKQYTIYDCVDFLTDESRRKEIIQEGRTGDVAQWWYDVFPLIVPNNDRAALGPVVRKIQQYAGIKAAWRVLGQRRSTLDISDVVQSGKILLVNSALAQAEPEVSSLIGGAILNLINYIVKRQGQLPAAERRKVRVVVDEMQTFSGVPFEEMISELRKFGGSLLMATQSLGRLNEMTENRTMTETLLANARNLIAFQINASDAELVRSEMGRDLLDEQDIVNLPPHHSYGRLLLGDKNVHFSMELLPPLPGNPGLPDLIRRESDAYTRSAADLDADYDALMEKFKKYFDAEDKDTFDFGSDS